MKTVKSNLAILLTAFLLVSCSRRASDIIRVTSPLPTDIVKSDQVFKFSFSRAIAKQESTNVWMTTPFIEFTPSIAGKFIWADTSTLVFSPDAPLPGDTKFQARINTALLTRVSGLKGFEGKEEFTFATESFHLKNAEFFYDRLTEKRTIGIRANLEFTYAVNPSDVSKFIKLTIDKEPRQDFVVTTTKSSRIIPLELGTVSQSDKAKEIVIDVDEQLVSTETNTHVKRDRPFVFNLPGIEELRIYGHEFGFDGTTSWITLKTSQEVDSASARQFISLDPARAFTLEGDRQSLTLRGKFEPGSTFHLLIKKGMESVLEAKTQNDYQADIVIGNVKPSFRFASSSGVYMLLGGQRKIELKTVNLSKVNVRVSQIFNNNLVFFLDGGRSYDYEYGGDNEENDEEDGRSYVRKFRYHLGNYGRVLASDSLAIDNVTNQEVTTLFDLNPYLRTDYKGFYLLEIANPVEPWRSTAKLISVSDIGLTVKRSSDELMVFATNLLTTEPVSGATISLVSTNNQVFASLKTDKDGVAAFAHFDDLRNDFELKLVLAELGTDVNFINLADYRIETSRFDVGGKRDAEESSVSYDAFLYGDRNIYRPGERIYVSGIVRNLAGALPANLPVRLRIYNPRGTRLNEFQYTLNAEGSFEMNYETLPTAQTGTYQFQLLTGNEIYLAEYSVSVEDFVPDRLKVNLKASRDMARPGETIKYDAQAMNFFGPPAANRNYEFEGTFSVIPYVSKKFSSFRFSDEGAKNYVGTPYISNGKTDGEGKATIQMALSKDLTSSGLLRARGRIAVFDESGRPVYQIAQTTIYPKEYYIGIRNSGDYYISPHSAQKFQLIAVDPNDKPIDGFRAKIELVRFEWHSVLRQHANDNTLRYVSEKLEIIEKTDTVTLGTQPVDYLYTVARSGEYIMRVSKAGDNGYNQFSFYSYSWGTSDITSFKVDPEARVQIVFSDSVYAPGQKAKVLFQTPFNGKMLVTVERNQVFSYQYVDVSNNAASVEIPIEEEYLPNVYVSAVLFRKMTDLNIPLMAGHGFAPLLVERQSNKLDVVINAPEKIRPKTKQTVTVRAGKEPDIFVTLAAVDEGICQVKNYKTPDPYGYFYAKKALETETFDFFKDLIPEPLKSSPGGSDEGIGRRVNPLGVKRFKPVALWSGIVKTNSAGEVNVVLDVPEFSGELRLMALAYKNNRFGATQRGMKVADPVVITPALPRFLCPNDSIAMPITAFNTTDKPVKLTFHIETSGGIIALATSASLELGANQESFVTIPLSTANQIGKAVVKVKTTAFGEQLESTTELPIRPNAPYATEAITSVIEGGSTASHDIPDVYLPSGRRAFITLSPFPVANFAKELHYLVGYPYGCLEQTVSKAFPQVYLRDIAAMLDPSILNSGSPTYFVNEAITKITAMQLADGSFSYWPGGSGSNPWTTVYATHFLLEAKKAGYAVQDATLKLALDALTQLARSKRTEDYYSYGPGQRILVRRIADKSSVYALYVLALGGMPEKSVMNFYRTDRGLLTGDTQYLLAGAFALIGDRRTYLELLPPQFVTEEAQRQTGYNFDSPIRANALILNILLDTDVDNPNISRYMDYLSRAYRASAWYSTQDDAFTLLAFGKAARMASATKVTGKVVVGSKEYGYQGGNQKLDIDPFGKKVTISLTGEGRVYYSLVTEGIRTDGKVRIEDKNLQIRREFLNRFGSPVSLSSVRQNDLVIVKLTLNSSINQIDNIAITDLLPGGFEIENPRITEAADYGFAKNSTTPVYQDIRDDRMNIYTNIQGSNRQQVFYYMVRAVSSGTFNYAPVVAEAMYNGDYYSASGQTKVTIIK